MRIFSTYGAFNTEIQALILALRDQEKLNEDRLNDFFYGSLATPLPLTTIAIFHNSQIKNFEKYVDDVLDATGTYPENITKEMMKGYKRLGFTAIRDTFSQTFGSHESALALFDKYTKESVENAAEFCGLQSRIYSELHEQMNKDLPKTWEKKEKIDFFFKRLSAEMDTVKDTNPTLKEKILAHIQLMGEFIKRVEQLSPSASQVPTSPRLSLFPASHERAVETRQSTAPARDEGRPTMGQK